MNRSKTARTGATPSLRFSEFVAGPAWERKRLGDVSVFSSGGTPSKINSAYWNGCIPWISASSMHETRVRSSELRVTEEAIGNGTRIAPRGSLLILVRGSMLFNRVPICIAVVDVAFNQDVKALALDKCVDGEFLLHELLAQESLIPIDKTGIGAGKIETEALAQLELGIPSLAEQQKIAECLSTLDELIGAESQKLDALKTHKKGLMQQIFPREGETLPRLRFPEFEYAPEWTTKKLGDFCVVSASGDLDDAFFSKNRTDEHRFPVFSNAVENEGIYGYYSTPRYQRGSVTITARGTLGVAFLRRHDFMGIGRLLVLSNIAEAEPAFVRDCWNHLAKIPHEVTSIPQLTAITARAAILPLPTLEEQQRIASCLGSLDDLIAVQSSKLEALKTHKSGLMQQLFPKPEET